MSFVDFLPPVSTAEVLHGCVRFRRVCFEAGSPALSHSTDLSMGHHLEGRELCLAVSFRDALPYRPSSLDATSYHGRSGISKGPMGQKSWENVFLRDTRDHSSHLPCRIGEFFSGKKRQAFHRVRRAVWGRQPRQHGTTVRAEMPRSICLRGLRQVLEIVPASLWLDGR